MTTTVSQEAVEVTQEDLGWATSAAQHLCSPQDRDAAIRLLAQTFARHRQQAERAFEERERKLREDAARYRWLRDISCPPHNFYISVPDEFHGVKYGPGEVDAYIDAARQALKETHNDQ